MYETIKQSLQTHLEPVIISITEYEHKGALRKVIKARKARGKNVYQIVQYENGLFSSAV